MNKTKYKITVIFLLAIAILLFLSTNVLAIGIAPGTKTIHFEPELEQDIGFSIINNEHKHLKVILFVRGELNQSVILPKSIVELSPEQESVRLGYKVKLPKKIKEPGTHIAEIVAMEIPGQEQGQTVVGASAAVISKLKVEVPVPGKYAEAKVDISEGSFDKPTMFVVKLFNKGKQDIVRAKSTVEVFGPTNEKLATLETQERSAKSGQRTELVTSWLDENINPGPYFATITVFYDGKTIKLQQNFEIGSLLMDIEKIEVKNFRLGGVAKFDITVENKWNKLIEDVFVQMQINDEQGDFITESKSSSENIEALSKTVLNTFWDTEGVKEGTYDTKVILHYQDKQTERQYKSFVSLEKIRVVPIGITGEAVLEGGVGRSSILVILIVLLIIINIGWLIYFKKRGKSKSSK